MHPAPVEVEVGVDTMDLVKTSVGRHIYDHPVDFATTLQSVTAGRLAPEQTVQATFPVGEVVAAVRAVPGGTWIDFASWRGSA